MVSRLSKPSTPRTLTPKVVKSADGTPIYAEAIGDASKPAIVFVHGFALSSAVFEPLFQNGKLLEKYYLVRYDARGHARSGQPEAEEAYESQRYAEDFQAVSRAYNLHKPIWAGWSVAGAIAADIVGHLGPESVSAIVLIGGVPCMGPLIEPMQTMALKQLVGGLLSPDAAGLAAGASAFVNSCFVDPSSASFLMKTSMIGSSFLQSGTARLRVLMRQNDPARLFDAGAKGLPLLVIYGTEDALVNPAEVIKCCKANFKRLMVQPIEGCGHASFLEAPEAFSAHLVAFADQVC